MKAMLTLILFLLLFSLAAVSCTAIEEQGDSDGDAGDGDSSDGDLSDGDEVDLPDGDSPDGDGTEFDSTPEGPWCGNAVCEFGEFCAICPEDCDCDTLAATPPMGWNSWNNFACEINETLIKEVADAMVDSGMRDAGYQYINIDDCWQVERDVNGEIVPDPVRFAGGIKALADYVHSKGLKFGIYTCAGTLTCEEKPGSYGYEAQDAKTYADWGVDYIKVDWCFTDGMDAPTRYAAMRDGIAASGRPMIHSICNWGVVDPWIWGPERGQLWRTTMDIMDLYASMQANFALTEKLAAYAGPGHWNDPDMLEVGNGGMTDAEYRAHMSLWSVIAAPLIAGNDLRDMTTETLEILTNTELIAVNQDPAGIQGAKLSGERGLGVWSKPLSLDGARAVVMHNAKSSAMKLKVSWQEIGLSKGEAMVRDPWAHEDLGLFSDGFSAEVPGHGAVMIIVHGEEAVPPAGESYLSDLPFKYAANSLGPVERDASVGAEEAGDGVGLSLDGVSYDKGLGLGAASVLLVSLDGRCSSFSAYAGLDDEVGDEGSVVFEVWADGLKLAKSGTLTGASARWPFEVDISGKKELKLVVTNAGDSAKNDHADWADAKISCQ